MQPLFSCISGEEVLCRFWNCTWKDHNCTECFAKGWLVLAGQSQSSLEQSSKYHGYVWALSTGRQMWPLFLFLLCKHLYPASTHIGSAKCLTVHITCLVWYQGGGSTNEESLGSTNWSTKEPQFAPFAKRKSSWIWQFLKCVDEAQWFHQDWTMYQASLGEAREGQTFFFFVMSIPGILSNFLKLWNLHSCKSSRFS